MTDDRDDLADRLGPRPAGPDAARVEQAIRRRTAAVVIRRKWVRRGKLVAAAVVLLAAGGVAGWSVKPTPDPAPPVREFVAVPVPVVLPPPEPPAAPPTPPAGSYLTAEQLELQAEQADRSAAAELYRRAGDLYLTDRNDSAQAARCYRLYLLRATPNDLAVTPDDSWLLIALKLDQRKEKTRVPDQGL